MKYRPIAALLQMVIAGTAWAEWPEKVLLPIETIYAIEQGFDDNDAVEVAVHGYLPDTCHKLEKGSAVVDHVNKTILVTVEGYVKQQGVCLEMLTPFLEVIQVGMLKSGDYTVKSAADNKITASLGVKERTTDQQDDYLYAPVDTVELLRSHALVGTNDELVLKGTYPHLLRGCMRVVDVKTTSANGQVMIVQPIVDIFEDKDCDPKDVDAYNHFTVTKGTDTLLKDKGLVHVRTLNGRALNKFVDFTKNP